MIQISKIFKAKNEYVKSDSNKENLTTVLRRSLALSRSLLGQKFVNIFEVLFWVNRSRTPCCCGKKSFLGLTDWLHSVTNVTRIPTMEWMHTTENNWKQSNASQANAMHPNVFRQFHNFHMCVHECQERGLGCLENTRSLLGQKKSTLLRFFGGANRSRTEFTVAKQLRSFPLVVGVGDK